MWLKVCRSCPETDLFGMCRFRNDAPGPKMQCKMCFEPNPAARKRVATKPSSGRQSSFNHFASSSDGGRNTAGSLKAKRRSRHQLFPPRNRRKGVFVWLVVRSSCTLYFGDDSIATPPNCQRTNEGYAKYALQSRVSHVMCCLIPPHSGIFPFFVFMRYSTSLPHHTTSNIRYLVQLPNTGVA